jgi:hypothetical protein
VSERLARLVFRHPALGYLGTLLITTIVFETACVLHETTARR